MENVNIIKCPYCESDNVDQLANNPAMKVCLYCNKVFSAETAPSFTPLKLFLSYGHGESTIVERIMAELKKRGHKVWIDRDKIKAGHDWREKIEKGVRGSNGVIACLSRESVRDRGVCLDELSIAVGVHGGNIKTILLGPEQDVEPPASLTHIQWVDMHDWRQRLSRDPESFETWFSARMSELFTALESKDNLGFQRDMDGIRDALQPYVDDSIQRQLLSHGFVGREWLAEKVVKWLDKETSKKVCLLTGSPGVGKSAFAAHFAHYGTNLRACVAAAIFCEANEPHFNDTAQILRTLAYLLACRLPDYRGELANALRGRNDLSEMNEDELFAFLLSDPLTRSIDGQREFLCIIIDGLDEAGSSKGNALANAIGRFADRLPRFLKILVVSRGVSSATSPIAPTAECIDIDSCDEDNRRDVRVYLEEALTPRFARDSRFEETVGQIATASDGVMLYAYTIVDALNNGNVTLQHVCKGLPQGLPAIFYQWFLWTFPDVDEYAQKYRDAIGCILAAPAGALPEEELRRVFAWSRNDVKDFKRRLGVFLRTAEKPIGGTSISLSHAFLAEWLASDEAGYYQTVPEDGADTLAECFYRLMREDVERLTDYEAAYLLDLLKQVGRDAAYQEARSKSGLLNRILQLGLSLEYAGKYTSADALTLSAFIHFVDDAPNLPPESFARLLTCRVQLLKRFNQCYAAGTLCQQALEIYLKLAKSDSYTYLPQAIDCGNAYAALLFETGRVSKADEFYRMFLSVCRKHEADNPKIYLRREATLLRDYARLLGEAGNFDLAKRHYEESLQILGGLADSKSAACLPEVALCHEQLASLLVENGRYEEAEGHYEESLRMLEALADSDPAVYQPNVALCKGRLADLLGQVGRYEEAEGHYEESLRILRELVDSEPAVYSQDFAKLLHGSAIAAMRYNRKEKAEALFLENLRILGDAYGGSKRLYSDAFAQANIDFAGFLLANDKQEEAFAYLCKAIEISGGNDSAHEQISRIIAGVGGDELPQDAIDDLNCALEAPPMPELRFLAVDGYGQERECDTLFMFASPETERNYIVYTDNTVDEDGNTRVYASIYEPEELVLDGEADLAHLRLIPIETAREWEIIETVLAEIKNQIDDAAFSEGEEEIVKGNAGVQVASHDVQPLRDIADGNLDIGLWQGIGVSE